MEEHKIIVAYDFQELSKVALEQSFELARFVNSGILLLLVMNDSDLLMLSNVFESEHTETMKNKITEAMRKKISERLKEVAEKASAETGLSIDYRVESGKIYERIIEVSKEKQSRFIVMGKTSRQSSNSKFGSNAMHVVSESTCPVITIPSVDSHTAFKNIVLPIDLTKQTREEVFNAISFGLFFDATIHLVSVVMGGIVERKSRIYRKMQQMKQIIEENGVRCDEKLFKKSHQAIHEVILNYTQSIDAGSIMIMTHQEISTSDKYIGAVAHQIINDAKVPVISLTSAAVDNRNRKTKGWFDSLFGKKD